MPTILIADDILALADLSNNALLEITRILMPVSLFYDIIFGFIHAGS